MINEEECLDRIFKTFPNFIQSKEWKSHMEFWGEGIPSFFRTVSVFSDYAIAKINENSSEIPFLMHFAEDMVQNGNENVVIAFCTGFLENIINRTPHDIPPEHFVPFLGKESIDYCKAWDEFTEVKTPGLWD
jgi:hypothetical protein